MPVGNPAAAVRPPGRARMATAVAAVLAAVVAAAALAGCSGQEQSGTSAQRVSTWIDNGSGGTGIGSVELDVRNVDQAIARHNRPAAIREVCALLSNDAQAAIGNLPAPDDTLTNDLNNAYMVATSAGDDCFNGAAGKRTLLARSAAERARVLTMLATTVTYVTSVTGHTPTTATTAPQGGSDPFSGNP